MKRKGISLIVLIITIIVIIIIAGTAILTLGNNGILDKAKKARFMNDFREVESGVNLYSLSKCNTTTVEFELPLKGYLTIEDKAYIKESVPTLNTKIEELSGSIDTANLAWISSEDIGVKLSNEKQEKGYILDATNGQIYDYIGDVFEEKRWHTLDGGVAIGDATNSPTYEELWDGWIKLTLYYPAGSTEKKWRLGTEGELRVDPMLMWQNYTGPITIPLDRVKDVWIKYILDNKEVIIPPVGTLLVDIVPDKTGITKVDKVNVTINYDEGATTKEYRVGNSSWITYNGEFSVTENCIVEARAKKKETIYNIDGSILATRDVAGKDLIWIGNIGVEETDLEAPTITRLPAIGEEKARVQVTYPAGADRKIYKVNYGVEEEYTSEINVTNYGTYIIAYYYDSTGKRSKSRSIYINDTSTGLPGDTPGVYEPNSGNPPVPVSETPAPIINVNPTTIAEEVQVSINSPANADKVYIKLGRYGEYQEYTSAITVRQNMEVYAYYRTYADEKSDIGYGAVSNIKKNGRPYVHITANPYPWSWSYGANEVTVTINYSDANTIEYSEDGILYKPYTTSFVVTENKTIYARGINLNGVTETSLNITNIGNLKAPIPVQNLAVNINVNPEPSLSTTRVAKATVTIDYDNKATEKYYSIGRYGILQTYTGAFDVTSNCTIFAYAKATNAKGQTSKTIDNVSSGIAEPIITAIPSKKEQASKVNVTIAYDKYSTVKRYSIDGGSLRDYAGSFEVTKNGSVIYAYSENDAGQKSESSYTIENIVPEPPTLLLDKGNYFLLKLNYPQTSKNREYKWKENGEWKGYKEAGILLVKPQFKDSVIQNGTLLKIEDENGNLVTFTGDYYLIDVPISELFENLFMRWDRQPLSAPQILITPISPSMQVTATITYPTAIVKKQYKIIKPGEVSTEWQDYTGPITINRNNTIIYAKGMDDTEVWSAEGMKKVTNIDENSPIIKLTADLDTAMQKVAVKVNVTDDVAVGKVKWIAGIQGESYFTNSGTEIQNDSIVNITSNGYYTFYAEDQVGNKQVYTLNVTNVDLTAPSIDIQVSPENTVGLSANIYINYGDSTIKQYKIGTSNATWNNYTTAFDISSYTVLANNWQNVDETVTVYAKGKDAAGNEVIIQKKVISLDLDKPKLPVINSNSSYATLTSYGVIFDKIATITYDSRTDIDNYYSIDNGVTWLSYVGQFDMSNGTVIAKSVKKSTGLESIISKTISMPPDALKPQAYDGDDSTYINSTNQYMQVDSSMVGKNIRILAYSSYSPESYIKFLDSNKTVVSNGTISIYNTTYNNIVKIPENTKWIMYVCGNGGKLYEIQQSNEPTFATTNGYMLLAADPTKNINEPYQMVTINYFPTSVQRMYKIGAIGDWINYNDQPIKVNQGQTLYAKGIDQYGKETRKVSSITVNIADALKPQAYDGDDSTYINSTNQYMQVDSSMVGKNIRILAYSSYSPESYIKFLDSNKTVVSNGTISIYNTTYNNIIKIPENTKWIMYVCGNGGKLYEIQQSNEPTFATTNGYMLLAADPTKNINEPYQMVTVNYFPTSVQRMYKIGATGDWINYNDQPIKVNQGQTLYAKGTDKYGNETRIISSITPNISDAIKKEACDKNDGTYTTALNQYMLLDSSMIGKNIRIKAYKSGSWNSNINFRDSSNNNISSVSIFGNVDIIALVPPNATKIFMTSGADGGSTNIYEIQSCDEPTFTTTSGYIVIATDLAKEIKEPYQMVTVNYFPTSVQRLYRIGSTGDWVNYINQAIKVNHGETLYAKGINQYGSETRIISSISTNVPDAIKKEVYDGNDSTFTSVKNQYMLVDSSMIGKNIRIKAYKSGSWDSKLTFRDSSNNVISSVSIFKNVDKLLLVPSNTAKIYISAGADGGSTDVYVIQPSN